MKKEFYEAEEIFRIAIKFLYDNGATKLSQHTFNDYIIAVQNELYNKNIDATIMGQKKFFDMFSSHEFFFLSKDRTIAYIDESAIENVFLMYPIHSKLLDACRSKSCIEILEIGKIMNRSESALTSADDFVKSVACCLSLRLCDYIETVPLIRASYIFFQHNPKIALAFDIKFTRDDKGRLECEDIVNGIIHLKNNKFCNQKNFGYIEYCPLTITQDEANAFLSKKSFDEQKVYADIANLFVKIQGKEF